MQLPQEQPSSTSFENQRMLVINVILNHGKLFTILSLTPLGTQAGPPGCYGTVLKWQQCYFLRGAMYLEAWSHWETYRMKDFPFSLNWKLKFYSIVLVSVWCITAIKIIALIVTAHFLFLLYEVCYVFFGWWKCFPHVPKCFQKSTI